MSQTLINNAPSDTDTDATQRHAAPMEHHGVEFFADRHIGPDDAEIKTMLDSLGVANLAELIEKIVPPSIRLRRPLNLPPALPEHAALEQLRAIAAKNTVRRSLLGMGYHACLTAPVIQRNILENPGWYTQYTPYQAEIAQGRLEALLNFQTMVSDLTGLPLSNASLLDEATAAAEAMAMCHASDAKGRNIFMVASDCHPQTIAVVKTRAAPVGITVRQFDASGDGVLPSDAFAILLQYPGTFGAVRDYAPLIGRAKAAGIQVVMAADILALTLLKPPGELGADVAVGSTQRFGVPMAFGGPHAAYMAATDQYVRKLPGRLVGVSRDAAGAPAYRLALQTREQHIRREKATSNICTAQVLLAVIASMHAVYHGPAGLKRIATTIHGHAVDLAAGLAEAGYGIGNAAFFDTLMINASEHRLNQVMAAAEARGFNLRRVAPDTIVVALDEWTNQAEIDQLLRAFGENAGSANRDRRRTSPAGIPPALRRQTAFLTHPVFNQHHSETEMLRYIQRLGQKDLSLTTSMIPLGSCTMKLNATAEMLPITWRHFARMHPYAPADQTAGYIEMCKELEVYLAEITGFPAVSLQPNAGSQGEYAGLLAIRGYYAANGQGHRSVCLVPVSAHGTNPASAAMAGFKVAAVLCDENGDIDVTDLKAKAREHAADLACIMVTYPSTHGVFEERIREICQIIHEHGGQVYMDGANMNAQVGLCRPADIGADVCHLNLHKTFCIPHGGGGPGVGPIGVAAHLAPFLPGDPLEPGARAGPVAAANYGSAGILPIPWMYIRMMGAAGLARASMVAILNANYMARRLKDHYPLRFAGRQGFCAHEFIIDLRPFEQTAGIKVEDVAKRLMDFGFHAPTMSWPEPGTMMIEPTESESKGELDRFCDALITIRKEIAAIESDQMDRVDNPLKNAPHTAQSVTADDWQHPYGRQTAAYPAAHLRDHKFWPAVGRIDNPYGDRNLFCTCPPAGA